MKHQNKQDVDLLGVSMNVHYDIIDESFDHAFGTEKYAPYKQTTSVFVDSQDITELLNDKMIDKINEVLNANN